eukprot:CAMPEP_0181183382 /NCGR_PEP_ID=MMETSP1096-20121128/8396_1 /TAXON_ID=156174 ORGANISM="Chrysochromulina ericina, Strain CCMP281" /NCGR_SAMPLE_ID=MMETSP1096 /ASSEMBLY_ACC=CAM_ASM_000453 /LENGTH=78 /DNA_ID=CAMNT_0023272059 /DNA_START=110 /DNA_END=346 /DNA_ORIENTATION=-
MTMSRELHRLWPAAHKLQQCLQYPCGLLLSGALQSRTASLKEANHGMVEGVRACICQTCLQALVNAGSSFYGGDRDIR